MRLYEFVYAACVCVLQVRVSFYVFRRLCFALYVVACFACDCMMCMFVYAFVCVCMFCMCLYVFV